MLAHLPPSQDAIFPASGYQAPQYTQIPDLLLDYQMAHMSGAELKVALYICRRTFGFKKNTDTISFNQMLEGIVTQDGRRLDFGTGLSRDSLSRAIKSLEEKRVILVLRGEDEKGSKQTNLYALNIGQSLAAEPDPRAPVSPPPPTSPAIPAPRENGGENRPEGGSPKNGLGGSTIFGLGGSTKNRLGGSTEIGLTINSSNNKQHNNKQNNNSAPPPDAAPPTTAETPDVVVVALQAVGLSKGVARQLAAKYPAARIHEKLAFLEYLQEKNAVTHPAGWLRTAIVEDYGRPDGYLTPDERTAATEQEAQVSLFAYQLETDPPRTPAADDESQARQAARTHHLQRLRMAHQVQPEDGRFGEEVMELLHNSSAQGSLLHALLPKLEFLKYADHQALFAVENAATLKQLQHPGTQTTIRRTLRFLLREVDPQLKQEQIRLEFCLWEDEPAAPDEPKPRVTRKPRRKPAE